MNERVREEGRSEGGRRGRKEVKDAIVPPL